MYFFGHNSSTLFKFIYLYSVCIEKKYLLPKIDKAWSYIIEQAATNTTKNILHFSTLLGLFIRILLQSFETIFLFPYRQFIFSLQQQETGRLIYWIIFSKKTMVWYMKGNSLVFSRRYLTKRAVITKISLFVVYTTPKHTHTHRAQKMTAINYKFSGWSGV